jgi:hypothetical protein
MEEKKEYHVEGNRSFMLPDGIPISSCIPLHPSSARSHHEQEHPKGDPAHTKTEQDRTPRMIVAPKPWDLVCHELPFRIRTGKATQLRATIRQACVVISHPDVRYTFVSPSHEMHARGRKRVDRCSENTKT